MLTFSKKQFAAIDESSWAETAQIVSDQVYAQTGLPKNASNAHEIGQIVDCCRAHGIDSREDIFSVTKAALTKGDDPGSSFGAGDPVFKGGGGGPTAEPVESAKSGLAWQEYPVTGLDAASVGLEALAMAYKDDKTASKGFKIAAKASKVAKGVFKISKAVDKDKELWEVLTEEGIAISIDSAALMAESFAAGKIIDDDHKKCAKQVIQGVKLVHGIYTFSKSVVDFKSGKEGELSGEILNVFSASTGFVGEFVSDEDLAAFNLAIEGLRVAVPSLIKVRAILPSQQASATAKAADAGCLYDGCRA